MIIKFFFLAAASAMFMAYQTLHRQVVHRLPANADSTLIYAVKNNTNTNYPLNLDATQFAYSYKDVNQTYETAVMNDNIMHQNYLTLQGMLAQAKTNNNSQSIYERANPYNAHNKNANEIQFQLDKLKFLRGSQLDQAFMRLNLTYMSIQNSPKDGRPGLTPEQHADVKRKMEHLLALKQAVQFSDTGYFAYPTMPTSYLTAGLYTPALSAPLDMNQFRAQVENKQNAPQELVTITPQRPPVTQAPSSEMIEPVLQ